MERKMAGAALLLEFKLTVLIDAVPADLAERAEDGRNRLLLFLTFAMLDGGGAAETAVRFNADHRGVAFEVDPVTPRFLFVPRLQVLLAERCENFGDGTGGFFFRELD